jgi:hypothetical protein
LQDPETGQPLSLPISDALTNRLYTAHRHPIGSAFREVHALASEQFALWYQAKDAAQRMTDAAARQRKREMALRASSAAWIGKASSSSAIPTVAIATA